MPRLVLFRVVAPSLPDTGSISQAVSLPARRWTHRRRSRPTRSGPAHEKPTVSSRPLSSASRRFPTPQVHSLTTSHARWFRRPWLGPTSHLCNAPCRVLVRRTLDTRGRPSRLAPRHPVDQLRPLRRWHAGMHPGRVRFGRRTARLPSQLADEGAPCARGMAMEWELDLDEVNLEVNSVRLWVVHRGHREGSSGVVPVWRRDAPIPTEMGGCSSLGGGIEGTPGSDPVVQQRRPGLAWDKTALLHPNGCLPMEGRKGKCSEERLDTRHAGLDVWDHEGSEVHGNGERSRPTKSNLCFTWCLVARLRVL